MFQLLLSYDRHNCCQQADLELERVALTKDWAVQLNMTYSMTHIQQNCPVSEYY